tara:strand:+ start:388 stop:666 length:279 start_codon:yes stop_codon:yes gene_type:complete
MITGKCILVEIMSNIQPWLYPPHPSLDRIVYIPLQSAHVLEYQEEFVDAKGNIFWKTTDTTTISGATSVKEFLEQMKDYYETCSCLKSLDYT